MWIIKIILSTAILIIIFERLTESYYSPSKKILTFLRYYVFLQKTKSQQK